MADYERRLQRLEDLAAAASGDERDKEFAELIRKRSAELLNSKEVLAYTGPELTEEEWAPVREKLLAAAKLEQGKR